MEELKQQILNLEWASYIKDSLLVLCGLSLIAGIIAFILCKKVPMWVKSYSNYLICTNADYYEKVNSFIKKDKWKILLIRIGLIIFGVTCIGIAIYFGIFVGIDIYKINLDLKRLKFEYITNYGKGMFG